MWSSIGSANIHLCEHQLSMPQLTGAWKSLLDTADFPSQIHCSLLPSHWNNWGWNHCLLFTHWVCITYSLLGCEFQNQHSCGDLDRLKGKAVLYVQDWEECHHELHLGLPKNSVPWDGETLALPGHSVHCQFLESPQDSGIVLCFANERSQNLEIGLAASPLPDMVHFCICNFFYILFQGRKYTNDVAKLYSINVTNVIDGVASYCRLCAQEASGSSCTSCPPGHYINKSSGGCHPCAMSTYLKAHQPYGNQACLACGPGTKSNKVLWSSLLFLIPGQ